MKTSAAYVRVSTEDQAKKHGQDVQQQQISAYFALRGWGPPTRWYIDAASGRTQNREEWQRFLSDCDSGQIDRLVFTKIDRLARDDQVFIQVVNDLAKKQVQMVCIQQPFDSGTLFGRFIMKQMALMSWFEVETTKERTMSGHVHAASKGLAWGGEPPYGYEVDTGAEEAGRWKVVPAEAAVVNKIFELVDGPRLTLRGIALHLNVKGPPPRSGKDWWPSTLAKIVNRRELYQGKRTITDHELAAGQIPQHDAIL